MSMIDFNADPDTALRRQFAATLMKQGMDTSPIQHWTQGAARLAQALVAGMAQNKLKEENKSARSSLANALLGDGSQQPATPAAPQQAATPQFATASADPGKVFSNDEPSPLDPPSGASRDRLVRALVGEAGNQGPTGMQAVANVVRNRAASGQFGGNTTDGVLQAPNQFEPFNTPQGRARMASIDPNSPQYQQASAAVDRAYTGDDPTRGATHFYAPKAQAALGRPAPSWDNGQGVNIGDHRFFGGAGTPQVTAGMQPTDMSAQQRPQPTGNNANPFPAPVGQPQQMAQAQAPAPQPMPQQPQGQRNAPNIPPEWSGRIRALIENPATSAYGLQLASQFIKPSQPSYGVIGKNDFGNEQYGWIDPTNRTVTPAQMPGGAQQSSQPMTVRGPNGQDIPIPPGVDPKKFRADVTGAVADAATGKMTEVQANATNFANRMESAEASMKGLEGQGTSIIGKGLQEAPFGLSVAGNYLKSNDRQMYEQARSQFITGLLRKESGAAIAAHEFDRYDKEFFPQPGDSQQAIAQKAQSRAVAIEAMKKAAGPSYKSPNVQRPAGGQQRSLDDLLRQYGG